MALLWMMMDIQKFSLMVHVRLTVEEMQKQVLEFGFLTIISCEYYF